MIGVAAALGAVAVGRVAKGYRNGIAVTKHRVPWTSRARVVHLSDIHVGPSTPTFTLVRVAEVVTSLEPDVVVLTGDYVNVSTFYARRITDFVRRLPKPCIATLGNHDHFTDPERITFSLELGGAKVLRNESISMGELLIVGVDDGHSGHANIEKAFSGVDAERALVLSHFPNTADEIAVTRAPLVLSGHTHGGQIDVPWVTRVVARAAGNPYLRGFYRVGDRTDLYVNAGLGHSFPGLRSGRGTKPEIAVFDLDWEASERTSREERANYHSSRRIV
jgi:hypothetical protein